jgi:hypothetical protein
VEGAEGGGEADASQTPAAGVEGSCVVISFFSEKHIYYCLFPYLSCQIRLARI